MLCNGVSICYSRLHVAVCETSPNLTRGVSAVCDSIALLDEFMYSTDKARLRQDR